MSSLHVGILVAHAQQRRIGAAEQLERGQEDARHLPAEESLQPAPRGGRASRSRSTAAPATTTTDDACGGDDGQPRGVGAEPGGRLADDALARFEPLDHLVAGADLEQPAHEQQHVRGRRAGREQHLFGAEFDACRASSRQFGDRGRVGRIGDQKAQRSGRVGGADRSAFGQASGSRLRACPHSPEAQ